MLQRILLNIKSRQRELTFPRALEALLNNCQARGNSSHRLKKKRVARRQL